jgi:putative ABC transport system permease protein
MAEITWVGLFWCIVPVAMVGLIYWDWLGEFSELGIASARMFVQLLGVGYLLIAIFNTPSIWISITVLIVMFSVATWISVRPVKEHRGIIIPAAIALIISVSLHLLLSLYLVLDVDQWFAPRILIPLAGMYFANTMTSISLSAERYYSERSHGKPPTEAKHQAFRTAMIPQVNGLLAVGLVALPGMMTGQILSGVSPLIAVRYQIMIMTMLLGTCGVGSAILLWQLSKKDNK